MSCGCRETKNIWWYLFTCSCYDGRWRGRALFCKSFWRYRKYIWHDSFGVFFNRLIVCRFFGHRDIKDVSCGGPPEMYCFKCGREIKCQD